MKYNYLENMKEDIKQYIKDYDITEPTFDKLYDDMFIDDSITGNASGSYTFNTWDAEDYIAHNLDLLQEACEVFGCEPKLDNAEWCDVTIRCHLLAQALQEVLDEMEKD